MIKFLQDVRHFGEMFVAVFGPVTALAFVAHWHTIVDVLFASFTLTGFFLGWGAHIALWLTNKVAVSER